MRSCLHQHSDCEILVYRGAKGAWVLSHFHEVLAASDGGRADSYSVECNLDFMRVFYSAHQIERVAPKSCADHIFSIHRKIVGYRNSSACPKREPFDVLILREIGRNAIGSRGC